MPIRLLFNMLLQRYNLPLTYIAQETGCSVPALRRLKNERSASIKFETLERLCEVLICEPGELFEFEPNQITRHLWAAKRAQQEAVLLEKLRTPVTRNTSLIGLTEASARINRPSAPATPVDEVRREYSDDDLELD